MQEPEIKRVLKKYFKNVNHVLLTGSYADGQQNAESDIDLIFIDFLGDYFYNEKVFINSLKFQILTYPFNRLKEFILADFISCEGILISMFAKGKILIDHSGYLAEIQLKCRELFDQGPPRLSSMIYQKKLTELRNNLSDLKGTIDHYEKVFVANELFKQVAEFIAIEKGNWIFSKRHLARLLANKTPDYLAELIDSYKKLVYHQDSNEFINFVTNLSPTIRSNDKNVSSRAGSPPIVDNTIAIQIHITDNTKDTLLNKISFFVDTILQYNLTFYFFRSPSLVREDYRHECLYIVIRGDHKVLREVVHHLNCEIMKTEMRTEIGENIIYPVDIDSSLGIVDNKCLMHIERILSTTSDFILNLKASPNSFYVCIYVLLFMIDELVTHSYRANFINTFFELKLVSAYDNGRLYSKDQLIISKRNVLHSYQSFYVKQQTAIVEFSQEQRSLIDSLRTKLTETLMILKEMFHSESHEKLYLSISKRGFSEHKYEVIASILDRVLSTFMIPNEKKAYIIFILKSLST